jgi:hypothetical protein
VWQEPLARLDVQDRGGPQATVIENEEGVGRRVEGERETSQSERYGGDESVGNTGTVQNPFKPDKS